ncbi:hypothetical protein [Anaerofustis stercorihominis]|uniref:hypothetical protein n=1 Tax=Anaerofustis stercorihominis TaxID=214853 RepID=UPI00214BCAA2|nr:hypothetical protein [Anaerofustis stercorihominis]MCR2032858.1 hypothetical protein [Anaerofustis stercorihominis]
MITPKLLKLIYTFSVYLALAGILIFALLKIKKLMDNKGKPNLDENIVQNNTPKILTLSQSQLSKSLTVRYFSIFTFSGFLLVFGFMGIQTLANHITMKPSVVISFLLGLTGLVIFALVEYAIDLMVKHDAIFSANTVGLEALVYKDIKAKRGAMGKVRVSINDEVIEFEAVTNAEVTLRKGSKVKITNSLSDTCVVVE